jgi:hypothetical protein
MNEKTKELAEAAGFILWGDEPWNSGDIVDWAVSYDTELEKFEQLVRADQNKQTLVNIVNLFKSIHESSKDRHNYWKVAASLIEAEYKVSGDV